MYHSGRNKSGIMEKKQEWKKNYNKRKMTRLFNLKYMYAKIAVLGPAKLYTGSFCFVSSETKRYCFQFRGELFT